MGRQRGRPKSKSKKKDYKKNRSKPDEILKAWQILFGSKSFSEATSFFKGKIKKEDLNEEQLCAWRVIFNGLKPREIYAITKHHVIPRSRGGTEGKQNILLKPNLVHQAWHVLFNNKKPERDNMREIIF